MLPKNYPFTVETSEGQTTTLTNEQIRDKELVFISFGDKVNNFSGDCDEVNIETVNFNSTNFAMVDRNSGLYFHNPTHFWISNKQIDFELVLEDYSQKEHQ